MISGYGTNLQCKTTSTLVSAAFQMISSIACAEFMYDVESKNRGKPLILLPFFDGKS